MNSTQTDSLHTDQKVDLHIHSDRSDGQLSFKAIVGYALQIGLKAISITDHDNISALESAEKYSKQQGLEFVSGMEISARMTKFDIHILGYFFDYKSRRLIEYVNYFQNERYKRAIKIVKNLNKCGISLSCDAINQLSRDKSIGRPHIAQALVEQKFVANYQQAFDRYIGDGRPCAVPKYKILPEEAISLINQAGGLSVLAHPAMDITDDGIYKLIKSGLEGIETLHPRHNQHQVDHLRELAKTYHLVETGGSDCHGNNGNNIQIGCMNVPYVFVENMKKRLGQLN